VEIEEVEAVVGCELVRKMKPDRSRVIGHRITR
jgi:hypothetical protein